MSDNPANWVERRARRESILKKGAAEVWEQLVSALIASCESFNKHYCHPNRPEVSCEPKSGNRRNITRKVFEDRVTRFGDETRTVTVEFDPNRNQISVSDSSSSTKTFEIASDEQRAFLVKNREEVFPDRFAEMTLDPILFGKNDTNRVITPPDLGDLSWMR